jgi:hypothetical protein
MKELALASAAISRLCSAISIRRGSQCGWTQRHVSLACRRPLSERSGRPPGGRRREGQSLLFIPLPLLSPDLCQGKCLERERAKKLGSVRAELAKNAPPIDYAASYDSLDIMEKVMRRFYLRGLIEEKMGTEIDWKAADAAFVLAVAIARRWRSIVTPTSRPSASPATSMPR